MNIMQPEQLFLLEFLVDSLYIHKLCGREINQREWLSAGQSVVTFQFLNFQMQAISDNDFPCPGTATGGPQKFESGKSCLFSIPDKDLSAPGKFIVYVGILKRQPPGIIPETLLVGEAQIDITDQFTTVLSAITAHPKDVPASSAIKEPFVIHYPETNEPVGQIHLFIRLSCFGKSIVTEFSLGNGQSYLFKGNEDSIYRCMAIDGVGSKSGGDSVTGCGKTINTAGCGAAAGGANAMNYGGAFPPYGPPMSHFAQTASYPGYGMVNPAAGYSGLLGADPGMPGGPGGGMGVGATGGALVPCDAPTPDAYVLRIKRTCPRGCDQRELLELACRPPPAPPAAAAQTQAEEKPKGGKKKKKKGKKKGKKKKKK